MRVAHPSVGEGPATSMAGEERESLYQVVGDRCQSLEEKQAKLREQFRELLRDKKLKDIEEVAVDSSMGLVSGFFLSGSPYKSVLECMGPAVHVYRASSGEIIYCGTLWGRGTKTVSNFKFGSKPIDNAKLDAFQL